MKFVIVMLFILSALFPFSAIGKGWQCRNNELEIECVNGKCKSSENFTPMNMQLSRSKIITICAYSGCWQGNAKILKVNNFITIIAHNMKPQNPSSASDSRSISMVIDVEDEVAIMKFSSFAQAMSCQSI